MPTEIVLLRHGQCTGNVAARASAKGDHSLFSPEIRNQESSLWPLTPLGVKQSILAGNWIRENISPTFDLCFSSDQVRSIETAGYLGFSGTLWKNDLLLREREWGGTENLPVPERDALFQRLEISPIEDSLGWHPPNGESMITVIKKLKSFFKKVGSLVSSKRVIIVSHGGPLQAFRVLQHQVEPHRYTEFISGDNYIRNCHIFHYLNKRNGDNDFPMYSLERSIFLDPNSQWIETSKNI